MYRMSSKLITGRVALACAENDALRAELSEAAQPLSNNPRAKLLSSKGVSGVVVVVVDAAPFDLVECFRLTRLSVARCRRLCCRCRRRARSSSGSFVADAFADMLVAATSTTLALSYCHS